MTQITDDTLLDDGSIASTLPEETHKIPPVQKVSRFGPQAGGSKFGKGAMHFNPPNKQRPGRAAGRGR